MDSTDRNHCGTVLSTIVFYCVTPHSLSRISRNYSSQGDVIMAFQSQCAKFFLLRIKVKQRLFPVLEYNTYTLHKFKLALHTYLVNLKIFCRLIKFRYCEKATKFEKISSLKKHYIQSNVKKKWASFPNFLWSSQNI